MEKDFYDLIVQRLNRSLSGSGAKKLDDWLSADEANQQLFNEVELLYERDDLPAVPGMPDPKEEWQRLAAALGLPGDDAAVNPFKHLPLQTVNESSAWSRYIMIAAAVFLVAATAWFLLPDSTDKWQTVATEFGQDRDVRLADGSLIAMVGGSVLEHPAAFSENDREVRFSGEALFSIEANPAQPFRIKAGPAEIAVLGTRFNVRERNNSLRVVVHEGKVQLSSLKNNTSVILTAGQTAVILPDGRLSKASDLSRETLAKWEQQDCLFEEELLSTIISELERRFYIRVDTVEGLDLKVRFTGSFPKEMSPDSILSRVGKALAFKHQKQGERYQLLPN